MAYQHAQSSHHASEFAFAIWNGVKSVASFFANIIVAIPAANQRIHELETLQAKSDERLAEMGLRREDIARYVFRDTLYL